MADPTADLDAKLTDIDGKIDALGAMLAEVAGSLDARVTALENVPPTEPPPVNPPVDPEPDPDEGEGPDDETPDEEGPVTEPDDGKTPDVDESIVSKERYKPWGKGKSGFRTHMGASMASKDAYGVYQKAVGVQVDAVHLWKKPADQSDAAAMRKELGGSTWFTTSFWWRNAPRGIPRVVAYRPVPQHWKQTPDLYERAAKGECDEMWEGWAEASRDAAKAVDCPALEVRDGWERNSLWYSHGCVEKQVPWARKASVRMQHVMLRVNPDLQFSYGFASPGNGGYANTLLIPRAVEEVPNWQGGTAKLPRRGHRISLSWYNKKGGQGSQTAIAHDMDSWLKKAGEKLHGAPAGLYSWGRWCRAHGFRLGAGETGNWGSDAPIYADGIVHFVKEYGDVIDYIILLCSGSHNMFGPGATCPKTGQRYGQVISELRA